MTSLNHIHCSGAKALLAHGADCTFTDPNGWTPLHFVASRSSVDKDVCEILLRSGANFNARNQEGDTPLHMMNSNLSVDVLSQFLEYQACLEAKNNRGHTVFLKSLKH